MWEKFSREVDGKFIEEFSWHSAKTEVSYNGLSIIFDNYKLWSGKHSKKMTRIIVPYYTTGNFKFEICQNTIIRKIKTLFCKQDFQIGRDNFDKKYLFKTNDEYKAKLLLQNQKIKKSKN